VGFGSLLKQKKSPLSAHVLSQFFPAMLYIFLKGAEDFAAFSLSHSTPILSHFHN